MNQEQLLDHVAELVTDLKDFDGGIVLLVHTTEFFTVNVPAKIDPQAAIIAVFKTSDIKRGILPSEWLALSKKLWAIQSSTPDSIKFPQQPSAAGGKPGRKTKPTNEPPATG